MPEDAPIVGVLVDFARELRAAGLAVGSGEVLTYCAAMTALDPSDLLDLYWAGRATLVTLPNCTGSATRPTIGIVSVTACKLLTSRLVVAKITSGRVRATSHAISG